MKVYNTQISVREFPDEITLAFNISGCRHHCPDCHSKYLWEDTGEELDIEFIDHQIENNPGITCIGFMGGDYDIEYLAKLAKYIRERYRLKTGLYSGDDDIYITYIWDFDYVKIGHYDSECGPLTSTSTNQRFWTVHRSESGEKIEDTTYKFWSSDTR